MDLCFDRDPLSVVLLLVRIRLAVIKGPLRNFQPREGDRNFMSEIQEESKPFVTPKSITHFIIASIVMFGYYFLIDWALMEVQGLNFFYLWTSGGH